MKTIFRRLVLTTTALASMAAAPANAQSIPDIDPAVWVVRDDDTTIYLFGTFHLLDGKAEWFNDEVKASFEKSSELILEANDGEDKVALQAMTLRYGLDSSGTPLTQKLSPAYQAKLRAALAANGMAATAFDKFKPFMASMLLTLIESAKLGMAAASGPEARLAAEAKARGMTVGQLEGYEYQLRMFAGMGEADQLRMLEVSLDEKDTANELRKMVDAWARGDAQALAALVADAEKDDPASHALMFRDRNRQWADWIATRMDSPGTVFVAVGAGHLVGRDSVQRFLSEKRLYSRRVAP